VKAIPSPWARARRESVNGNSRCQNETVSVICDFMVFMVILDFGFCISKIEFQISISDFKKQISKLKKAFAIKGWDFAG